MNILNLGILAHVDAGKTSLTERLLFNAGAIKTLGSVDRGSTQTDTMALERRRGITIRAAVTSFTTGALKVNLVDTPGHPDFIAEVERSLTALDAAILVVSAVEGIQPQTRILARALQKMQIPTVIFINKIDRVGAQSDELVEAIKTKLFPMAKATAEVINLGTRKATILANKWAEKKQSCPVFFGSAITGAGIDELTNYLPLLQVPEGAASKALSAEVFKIKRGKNNEKITYLRVRNGWLRARKPLDFYGKEKSAVKITAMKVFEDGKVMPVDKAQAGEIVEAWGLSEARIGDYVGEKPSVKGLQFARPSLEMSITPRVPQDRPKLYKALQAIAEQDPLIEIMHHGQVELSLRLYGEVQREIIASLLCDDYGLEVIFSKPQVLYIEKVCGTGESYAQKFAPGNIFVATLGFRVSPGKQGNGVIFKPDAGVGRIPVAYMKVVEEMVYKTLQQGVYGWEVTDCIVEVTHAGYESAMSTGTDFRRLTPLLIAEALHKAGTKVHEPMVHFELEVPSRLMAGIIQILGKVGATIESTEVPNEGLGLICGLIPVEKANDFERSIPDLTQGEGFFSAEPDGYRIVHGSVPLKTRTDDNPFNKEEYLRLALKRN